jgi:hypothetical protein
MVEQGKPDQAEMSSNAKWISIDEWFEELRAFTYGIDVSRIWGIMAEQEKPDQRPKCKWPVITKKDGVETRKDCGSEDRIYTVRGQGLHTGRARETPICQDHLEKAWKAWNVNDAQPCTPGKPV